MCSASRSASDAVSSSSAPSAKPASTSLQSRAAVANLCSGAILLSSVLQTSAQPSTHLSLPSAVMLPRQQIEIGGLDRCKCTAEWVTFIFAGRLASYVLYMLQGGLTCRWCRALPAWPRQRQSAGRRPARREDQRPESVTSGPPRFLTRPAPGGTRSAQILPPQSGCTPAAVPAGDDNSQILRSPLSFVSGEQQVGAALQWHDSPLVMAGTALGSMTQLVSYCEWHPVG